MADPSKKQGKYWCFTYNNPACAAEHFIRVFKAAGASYIIFGEEKAPETGTPHWQGYVEFEKLKRFGQVRRIVEGLHVEYRIGTQKQAIDYCRGLSAGKTPNEVVHEDGTPSENVPGKRNDIAHFHKILEEKGMRGLAKEAPEAIWRYGRNALLMESLIRRPKPVPKTTLCFGAPDWGKTRYFWDNAPEDECWSMGVSDGLWFDGYFGQQWALIDEFDGKKYHITLSAFLRVLDRYPVRVGVKGAFTQWTPEYIVITTNIHPKRWYDWTEREEQYSAMYRRFERVRWHKSKNEMVEINREDTEQWEHFWEHAPPVGKVFSW